MSQRRALDLTSFTQMWESFSYFGMRILLVLFLIEQWEYSDQASFTLYALYTALVELGALLGGYYGDKVLGAQRSVLLGGSLICLGHLCLSTSVAFFLGLGLIVGGSTLFRVNLKALLAAQYRSNSQEKEESFTLLYSAMNLGGLAAALSCGACSQLYGWHAGFSLAAAGMLIGIIVFYLFANRILIITDSSTDRVSTYALSVILIGCSGVGVILYYSTITTVLILPLTLIVLSLLVWYLMKNLTQKALWTALGLLLCVTLYFTCTELMGSLLMVYTERQVDRLFFGYQIPTSTFQMANPLTIILAGPLLNTFFRYFWITLRMRLGLGFLCLALSFAWLGFSSPQAGSILVSFLTMALGELFIAPAVYAYFSEESTPENNSFMMAAVTTAFALASLLSGQLSAFTANFQQADRIYLFQIIAIAALGLSGGMLLQGRRCTILTD